ncbi:MAG: energy transducer TonB [Firmicutes bacterium]|jgi:TonB family protein|nr:energy transducer TonB [Bacillota bacterium]
MKHDDDRMNMWFSLMVSILLHVAVILLVPITVAHQVTVYPVEFGEISQTFASTRQGSSVGTTVPTPAKIKDTTLEEKATVRESKAPAEPEKQKTEEEPKKEPAPQPGPETPVVKPEPETPVAKPEPETPAVKVEPETVAAEREPEIEEPKPEPEPEDLGRVLTGSSDETIPIPEAKEASPEPVGDAEGSGDTGGGSYAEDATGKDEETATKGNSKDAEEAGPQKPKGHEFGKGESLAINSAPPRYPKGAQNVDLIGNVELEVSVDRDGKIRSVNVSQASGYAELDEQARMTIVALWKFKGINWPYNIRVTVSFKGEADVNVQFGGVTVLED